MKAKNLNFAMMFIFFFLLLSCGKNEMENNSVIHDYRVTDVTNEMENNSVIHDYRVTDVTYAKGSKLKHISYVESVNSKKGGIIITQYEYDGRGRISKVSQPMYENGTPMFENGTIVGLYSYSDYVYNNDGQLEKIIYYHSNLYEGFINLETRTYSYDKDGNKLKEEIVYPRAVPHRTDYNLYFYDDNRLKREGKYNEGYHGNEVWSSKLITYIEYEYNDQGELIKEAFYSGEDNTSYFSNLGEKNKSYQIITHSYQNGLNVKTEIPNLREIRRYYDKNDNLIYLESEELSMYSSTMSYVTMYEYY